MKTLLKTSTVLLVLGVASINLAEADDATSPWSFSIFGGGTAGIRGSMRPSELGASVDLGSLNPTLAGNAATTSLDNLRYRDMFRTRLGGGAEVAYTFDDHLQTYGRFKYQDFSGRNLSIGSLNASALGGADVINAQFANNHNETFELGTRYLWSTGTPVRPFLGASLGATHSNAVRASLSTSDSQLNLADVHFSRAGTVFSQTLETGVSYVPVENIEMQLGLEAQHLGTPHSGNDPQLGALGLAASNTGKGAWSFPVSISLAYHF